MQLWDGNGEESFPTLIEFQLLERGKKNLDHLRFLMMTLIYLGTWCSTAQLLSSFVNIRFRVAWPLAWRWRQEEVLYPKKGFGEWPAAIEHWQKFSSQTTIYLFSSLHSSLLGTCIKSNFSWLANTETIVLKEPNEALIIPWLSSAVEIHPSCQSKTLYYSFRNWLYCPRQSQIKGTILHNKIYFGKKKSLLLMPLLVRQP